MNKKYDNVISGFADLCRDNDLTDEELIKVSATITAFAAQQMGIDSVNTPSGIVQFHDIKTQ